MPSWPRAACALISGTTSGTLGSIRHAFDLSTTIAPARTAWGAYSFDCAVPAETERDVHATERRGARRLCTRTDSPWKVTVLPTERSDAKQRSSRTGNLRSSRILSVVCPAAPVAPTTATNPMLTPVCYQARSRPLSLAHDQVPHLRRADQLAAGPADVPRPVALLEHPAHRGVHAIRIGAPYRASTASASPPTKWPRSGWRPPARRYRAPCRAPARRGPRRPPSEAEGSMPMEPARMAASSDRMSPNVFSVTIVSNCVGSVHERHGAVVHEHVLERHVGIVLRPRA